jgi:outer membrane protein TolC
MPYGKDIGPMSRTTLLSCLALAAAMLAGRPAAASPQGGGALGAGAGRGLSLSGAHLGGVPAGEASAAPMALTLGDAIARGLRQNLGVLQQEAAVTSAAGSRWQSLSGLLPRVSAQIAQTRQTTSLAAFGIDLPGLPSKVGPFNVFDSRLYVSQNVWDADAFYSARAGFSALRAERHTLENARHLVVLVVRSLYLQAVAGESRLKAARAQMDTAQVLYNLAVDLRSAGVVAGIDVLRAQVQLETQRQRAIVAGNDFEKEKLQLARAIGLPIGQAFTLADAMPYEPLKAMPIEEALQRAYESREDYRAAQARLDAALAVRKAAVGDLLPSVQFSANYGRIGNRAGSVVGTYSVLTLVRVPVFDASATRGRILEADGLLQARRAELADFRARVDEEVRSALLDLSAADEQLLAAQTAVKLAQQELTQSQDRFAAGVAGNIEVVQAQESVATATENYIAGLYAHNIAKASLARAIGSDEGVAGAVPGGRH